MKYLLIILPVIFFSCSTSRKVDKALQKVVSTSDFTSAQRTLLAAKCNTEFPVVEFISEGTKTSDSASFKDAIKSLERDITSAYNEVARLTEQSNNKEKDNDVLRQMLFDAQGRLDSLRITRSAYRTIPCPEVHVRDTMYKKATSELQILQTKLDQLQVESAKKDIQIEKAKAGWADAEQRAKEANAKKWKFFLIGAGVGAALLIAAKFLFKLKNII